MTTLDYCRYYDLETYLFEDVSPRFRAQGYLEAFDLFSIVIWKANRVKSIIAKKLLKLAAPGESLDGVCRRLTSSIYAADTDEERFKILFDQPWSFPLPMASAILTVLYPDNFTVYDYRVCDELGDFHKLCNITNTQNVWSGYLRFRAAVEASSSLPSLRDKDRALIGKSMFSQLEKEIREGFKISRESAI